MKHLMHKLSEWQNAGLLSGDQVTAIVTWEQGRQPAQFKFNKILLVLAAIMCSIGSILIVAVNWDMYSSLVRVIIAIVLVLASQAIFIIMLRRKSLLGSEVAAIVNVAAVTISTIIMHQVCQVQGDFLTFLFAIAVLITGMYFVFDYWGLFILAVAAVGAGVWGSDTIGWMLLGGILIGIFIYQIYHSAFGRVRVYLSMIFALTVVMRLIYALFEKNLITEDYLPIVIGLIFVADVLTNWICEEKMDLFGYIGIIIIFSTFMLDFWDEVIGGNIGLIFAGLCTGVVYALRRVYATPPLRLVILSLFWLVVVIVSATELTELAVLGWIFSSAVCLYMGFSKNVSRYFYTGVTLGIILVIRYLLDSGLSFTIRGVILILAGVGFILLNRKFTVKTKSERGHLLDKES